VFTVGETANDQSPDAFVVAVPAVSNVSNGNGSLSTVTVRPLLFCPVSFPDRVVVPPNLISALFGLIWRFFGPPWADSAAGIASMATTVIVMAVRFMSISVPR
jgi:hypothetical protein